MTRRVAAPRNGFARLATALLAAVTLSSCADDIVPPGPAPHVTITGGNEQSGVALDTLPVPLEVTVVDDEGLPVAGRTVSWTYADRTGALIPFAATTDARGRARAIWSLGLESGVHAASASVTGEDGAVEFTATASPVVGFKAIALMQGSTEGTTAHMCALAVDSLAWCWGGNATGKLGNGTTISSDVPVAVAGDRTYARIYGERFNTCGLRASGELWCWGQNGVSGLFVFGVFGNGYPPEASWHPVRAAQGLLLRDFDLEVGFACGVTLDGRAYCWSDGDGALGNGSGFSSAVPVEILGDRRWREVAVSDDYRCALGDDYRAYCWADPDHLRWRDIGVPPEAGPDNVPLLVEITGPLTDISVGQFGPCGLSLAGAGMAVCWGFGATETPPGPKSFRLGSSVRSVISDGYARAALDAEGQLWVWPGGCGNRGCDPSAGREDPVLLFPGVAWSDISLAHGLHALSARDSVVFSLGAITAPVSAASFTPRPVPLP